MSSINDLDKLRMMLPHWIEHNSGHGREYAQWSRLLAESGRNGIAELLKKAEASISEADTALKEALRLAGGPLKADEHHHHHNSPE